MHGRVKVRTTAEQEALKKKERAEKLARYRAGIGIVFEKRKNKIYDDELLIITERMLLQNSDIYTLWNIRREALANNDWDEKLVKEFYKSELVLTENCLKKNPKSYWIWYQRMWIMNHSDDCDWKKELMLCSKCLDLDERNFHCWNYRAFVVEKAGISPEEEFQYSTSKILNNFSNYSSWHYRSQLLSKIFHSYDQKNIDKTREDELELVMNATFTDPSDSSAWFYQRWLLDAHKSTATLTRSLVRDNNAILLIDKNISVESIVLQIDNVNEDVQWKSYQKTKLSKLWFGKFSKELKDIKSIEIQIEGIHYPLTCFNKTWICRRRKHESSYNKEQLLEQLSSYKQLAEMEPNNKWSYLTAVLLMKEIDLMKFYNDIIMNLKILVNIDYLRSNYYKDLQCKYTVEYKLNELWKTEENNDIKSQVDLSGLNLTTLGNNGFLSFYEEINLGANFLSDNLCELSSLQNCKKLSLSSNQLDSLKNFPTLENLEVLSLRNNKLKDLKEIIELLGRHKLHSLDIRDNPICNIEKLEANIKHINPDLQLYVEESSQHVC